MIDYTLLPTLNATLNGISGMFLLIGYMLIRQRHINAHRNAMLGAFASSTLFLVSYLVYHANVGSRPFAGQGPIRHRVFRHPDFARDSRSRNPADGHFDAIARTPWKIRRSQAHREVDVSRRGCMCR